MHYETGFESSSDPNLAGPWKMMRGLTLGPLTARMKPGAAGRPAYFPSTVIHYVEKVLSHTREVRLASIKHLYLLFSISGLQQNDVNEIRKLI